MTTAPRVEVRSMTVADIQRVASIIRTSFDPLLVPYMTAAQPGWKAFIRVVLSHPALFRGQRLVVAEVKGKVVGFADFRVRDATGFLSYICVDPLVRRSGVARRLLAHVTQASSGLSHVELDVFTDNVAALDLYRSLGFQTVSVNSWWRSPVGPPAPRRDLSIEQIPSALATFNAYGFCEIRGTLEGRSFRCGRIGEGVVRFYDIDDLRGPLPAAISAEFPEVDQMFAVLPGSDSPLWAAERMTTASRMRSADLRAMAGGGEHAHQ